MYHMKNIISHDDNKLLLSLPNCMYRTKNVMEFEKEQDIDINIIQQVTKFLKVPHKTMTELEERQDMLLKKLDFLYDRIKTISSYCKINEVTIKSNTVSSAMTVPEETVLVVSPDNLPWFLYRILAKTPFSLNITWHIHSSVPKEKVSKITEFLKNLNSNKNGTGINVRLIFKCADSELRLSSLAVPIVGNVNILRYLSYVYPDILPYNQGDFNMDGFLDICHKLERSPEKHKADLINKLFSQYTTWICNNQFSIVDVAAYNAMKQSNNVLKSVPKMWLENCLKIM